MDQTVGEPVRGDAGTALPPEVDDRPARRWPGAVAGLLGAAAALLVVELVALVDATGTSPTEAVGNRFIDSFAASLKEVAVALFGTNDKVALQIGTVVVSLAVGAWLGARARRSPNLVVAGFGAFGLLGVWAAWTDPLASAAVALVGCTLGALVGMFVTLGLELRWRRAFEPADAAADHPEATEAAGLGRRAVLVNGGVAVAVLVVLGGAVRSVRGSLRSAAATVVDALPAPSRRVPVPEETAEVDPDLEGVSPYITPTDDFYRIDTALSVPLVDVDDWSVRITGLVERELELTYDDLLARDLVEVPITMLCVSNEVGGDLVGTARWLGIPLAELLEEAGVRSSAEQIVGESVDGFTAGFPVEVALDGRDALLVVGMNGEPLPREHGYPARLVVPGIYGYVSATKWLSEIRLTTWEEQGYWIPRGWSRLGPIKTSSRIDVPRRGADLVAGRQAVAGVAWAPTRGIERVEVRVDGGPWQEAQLGPVASDDTWVQWWWSWDAAPGRHELEVRATDGDGATQTAEVARPAPDGATGLHSVAVDVR